MGFTKSSCEEFVDVLASKAPVPGGGGASALVGAIGMALGNMVGSLTVGKKKYADVEADMSKLTVVNKTTGVEIPVLCELTGRTKDIILAGGLLDYTREQLSK